MKIAHVVDSMKMGGAETLVVQLCRLQRAQGHAPQVFAVGACGILGEKLRSEGFLVHARVARHLADAAPSFLRLFRQQRPNVVHLHNPVPAIYAALPARIAGACSIVSTRHSLVASPHHWSAELKYACAARCCDWIVGICDSTTSNLNSLHTLPRRKIARVYNGAEPLPRAPQGECPPKTGFTLLYVGRLEPIKNHALLLHAFRDAVTAMPGLRLWIVGDGSQRSQLETLADDLQLRQQVTFWGEQLQVAPFFSAADLFILSSRSEGLPVSLLQAFCLGLPSIVTDVGGMAEVVRMADAGLTVSLLSPQEMTAAILRLATHSEERKRFAAHAAEAFRGRFTLEAMAGAYMDLYQNTPRALRQLTR